MFNHIYLHIPFCKQKCPYCAFFSQENENIGDYTNLLLEELKLTAALWPQSGEIRSIYFGGGTPSLMEPEQVGVLLTEMNQIFKVAKMVEITLEANPGTVDAKRLTGFKTAGVNRLSIGVQSFDNSMLAKLGRIHSNEEALEAFYAARLAGFENIGIDLISALPGESAEIWQKDLEQALLLAPEHLSVYGLTIEETTPFAKIYSEDSPLLPDEELSIKMFEMADDFLTENAYEHYEIANYALAGRRSEHNSAYWQRHGYLGVGAGAHSFLKNGNYGSRFYNPADLENYAKMIKQGEPATQDLAWLSRNDAISEFMFLGLRLSDGVDFKLFEAEFGVSPESVFGDSFKELIAMKLLIREQNRIRLSRTGRLLSNQVFSRFII